MTPQLNENTIEDVINRETIDHNINGDLAIETMIGNRSGYQQCQQNYDAERRHYYPPTSTQQYNLRIQRDWQQYQQNQIPGGQQNNRDDAQT